MLSAYVRSDGCLRCNTGRVTIESLVCSKSLSDLLLMRNPDEAIAADLRNWFSPSSAQKLYGQYLELDHDRNGMLSEEELCQFNGGSICPSFVKRLFEESNTYDGELVRMLRLRAPASVRFRAVNHSHGHPTTHYSCGLSICLSSN